MFDPIDWSLIRFAAILAYVSYILLFLVKPERASYEVSGTSRQSFFSEQMAKLRLLISIFINWSILLLTQIFFSVLAIFWYLASARDTCICIRCHSHILKQLGSLIVEWYLLSNVDLTLLFRKNRLLRGANPLVINLKPLQRSSGWRRLQISFCSWKHSLKPGQCLGGNRLHGGIVLLNIVLVMSEQEFLILWICFRGILWSYLWSCLWCCCLVLGESRRGLWWK